MLRFDILQIRIRHVRVRVLWSNDEVLFKKEFARLSTMLHNSRRNKTGVFLKKIILSSAVLEKKKDHIEKKKGGLVLHTPSTVAVVF